MSNKIYWGIRLLLLLATPFAIGCSTDQVITPVAESWSIPKAGSVFQYHSAQYNNGVISDTGTYIYTYKSDPMDLDAHRKASDIGLGKPIFRNVYQDNGDFEFGGDDDGVWEYITFPIASHSTITPSPKSVAFEGGIETDADTVRYLGSGAYTLNGKTYSIERAEWSHVYSYVVNDTLKRWHDDRQEYWISHSLGAMVRRIQHNSALVNGEFRGPSLEESDSLSWFDKK